jgi:hypothetical protein
VASTQQRGIATWADVDGTVWRIEPSRSPRWTLARWDTDGDAWQSIGSYPNRPAAIRASYGTAGSQR